MNVNQMIESALAEITENIWPLCCPEDSLPEKYIVYNPELDMPGYYADDKDEDWIQYMQIHLYTKNNFLKDREVIRERLRENDFVVTGIETFYEKSTGYNHLCFECYIEEEL